MRAPIVLALVVIGGCGRISFQHHVRHEDAGVDAGPAPDTGPPPTDAGPPCAYECTVNPTLPEGTGSTCMSPIITTAFIFDRYALAVDMTGHRTLRFDAEICESTGWTFHIADSESNNGDGGDSGHSSNDAEIQIKEGVALGIFGNDAMTGPAYEDFTYLPGTGCVRRILEVRDQSVTGIEPPFEATGEWLLRLNPPTDAEATAMGRGPDARWYVGINRTFAIDARSGTGVRLVRLCILD